MAKALLPGRVFPWGAKRIFALLSVIVAFCSMALPAVADERTVLVVSTFSKDLPAHAAFERGLGRGFQKHGIKPRLFMEHIDSPRLPLAQTGPAMAQLVRSKYQGVTFDAVVAWADPAADLVWSLQDQFPGTPVHLAEVSPVSAARFDRMPAIGYGFPADFTAQISEALRLSRANKVVAIGDDSPTGQLRRQWFRQGMEAVAPNVAAEDWSGMPVGEILARVPALPKGTILVYLLLFKDEMGVAQTPFEMAKRLSAVSSVPMFSQWESLMGSGVVGGHVLSVEVLAENIAASISGKGTDQPRVPMRFAYDWPQMERWGFDGAVLDPDAVILNRAPSVFRQYRWHIVTVVAFILALAALSAFLAWALKDKALALQELASERRLLAERVRERTRELAVSNAELEQFAYAISHDLRQPLRMVSSFIGLLGKSLAGKLNAEESSFLDYAVNGAKRMDQMIIALLDYSRLGRQTRAPEWFESRRCLDEVIDFLGPAIAEAGAEVTVAGEWPGLFAARDAFERVLLNLIGNAIKYRVPGRVAQIRVAAESVDGNWRFAVADNGIGIDKGASERLFGVFQRLNPSDGYEGTGVGLALCRRLIEQMGGEIWMESEGAGKGSVFRFTVPKAAESPASSA